jgi:parvulin-like peptidyl-prolyl isomerase
MLHITRPVLASLLLLSACGSDSTMTSAAKPTEPAVAPAESPKPVHADMDADIKALMAKPEQPDETIEIQHILIGFKGAPLMDRVTRSKDEAKALAQKVYSEVIGGANFDALVKQYTDDSAPGIYPLTKAGRAGMVKGFGDVGFRLKVGEIGVSPWDAAASPYGWHIIKRLK